MNPTIALAVAAEQKLAAIARTRRPTEAETIEARAAYEAAAKVEHCTECDGSGYHVDDCPRFEPELPARPTHCDRCGATLTTETEQATARELGYALCDDCEAERADDAKENE